MEWSGTERTYLDEARVGRLATTDEDGRPHAVPVCYALAGSEIVTPLDEKPKEVGPSELQRVRNIRANPRVTLVVDHYVEDWDELGWVQVRGTASLCESDTASHDTAVAALRSKYEQYAEHTLADKPIICIDPGHVVSWGELDSGYQ